MYVVKPDQTVAMQNVSVGTTDGNVTAVEGIKAGDMIAVDGFDKLQSGVKVDGSWNRSLKNRAIGNRQSSNNQQIGEALY